MSETDNVLKVKSIVVFPGSFPIVPDFLSDCSRFPSDVSRFPLKRIPAPFKIRIKRSGRNRGCHSSDVEGSREELQKSPEKDRWELI